MTVLEVSVRDHGPGVRDGENVFDMFVRGAATSGKPGVGLGLAICRAIVEAHGGTVSAHNEREGARFTFTLPLGNAPRFEGEELAFGSHT